MQVEQRGSLHDTSLVLLNEQVVTHIETLCYTGEDTPIWTQSDCCSVEEVLHQGLGTNIIAVRSYKSLRGTVVVAGAVAEVTDPRFGQSETRWINAHVIPYSEAIGRFHQLNSTIDRRIAQKKPGLPIIIDRFGNPHFSQGNNVFVTLQEDE